jgi:hypothetical protein
LIRRHGQYLEIQPEAAHCPDLHSFVSVVGRLLGTLPMCPVNAKIRPFLKFGRSGMREAPSASGTTHARIPMIYRPQLAQTRRAGLSWLRPSTARIEPTRRTDAVAPPSGAPRGRIARRPAIRFRQARKRSSVSLNSAGSSILRTWPVFGNIAGPEAGMFCLRNKLGSMHAKPASSRNSRGGIIARIPDSIFKQPGQFRCRTVIAIIPHATSSSRREAPVAMMNLPPKEGVGNAGCPLHPRPRVHLVVVERTRVTTSTPESPDVPARNGFNGVCRALPGDRAVLPPSSAD